MKKSVAFCILIAAELAALYAAYQVVDCINYGDLETFDERKTDTYEVRDKTDIEHFKDGNPDWLKILYYLPDEKIVRVGSSIEKSDNEIQIMSETRGYAIVKEGASWNVYGPGGKAVFENDRKVINSSNDAMLYLALELVDDDHLIADRSTGEYFDLDGKPVSNMYTFFNRLYFTNPDAVHLSIFGLFFLITGLLWYFILWRKRNNK